AQWGKRQVGGSGGVPYDNQSFRANQRWCRGRPARPALANLAPMRIALQAAGCAIRSGSSPRREPITPRSIPPLRVWEASPDILFGRDVRQSSRTPTFAPSVIRATPQWRRIYAISVLTAAASAPRLGGA